MSVTTVTTLAIGRGPLPSLINSRRTSFDPNEDIPDLTGKVILITDGETGIGFETARQLVKRNPAQICIASSDVASVRKVILKIAKSGPGVEIWSLELDLSSFDSIKRAASLVLQNLRRLDILINNAGVDDPAYPLTADGYEFYFGTNLMGPALFTQLLLPLLRKTSAINPQTRIVTMSDDYDDLAAGGVLYDHASLKTATSTIPAIKRYAISKIACVHYTSALALRETSIKCISVHAGHELNWRDVRLLMKPVVFLANKFGNTVEKQAHSPIWAAVSPQARSGEYYTDAGIPTGNLAARNPRLWEELWDWVQEELAGHL